MSNNGKFRKGFIRELKNLLYDRNLFLIALIAPIFYLFLYGSVYLHNVVTTLNVAVVDYDKSITSHHLTNWIGADKLVKIYVIDDIELAKLQIEQGKIQGFVIIPQGLEKNLKSGRQTVLGLYANTNSFLVSNELNKRFVEITESINTALLQKYWLSKGLPRQTANSAAQPVKIDITPLGNPEYGYSSFLYVAIFLLILHQLGIMILSESLAKEKESGTIYDWSKTSGNNVIIMLLSKTTPYFILNLLYYLMLIVIAYPIFHLPVLCPILQLILLAIPFYLSLNALGWVLGRIFQNMLQAFQLIVISSMPIILVSGYLWPVYALPLLLKPIPFLLPTYPMMIMMQAMTQTSASLWQLWSYWLILWIQALMYGCLGYYLWNKKVRSVNVLQTGNPISAD